MKKLICFTALLLCCATLTSCSITDMFGQVGITSPNTSGTSSDNTSSNNAYETVAVGEKMDYDALTLADYITVNYKDLELEVKALPHEVTDKEVNGQFAAMLDYYKYEYTLTKDRPVEEWDYVEISFVGKMNGEEFEGGTSTSNSNMLVNEAESGYIEGFASAVIGVMPGQTAVVDMKFPDDYYEDLAGKDVTFEITVHGIVTFNVTDEDISKLTKDAYKTIDSYLEYYKNYLTELQDYNLLNEVYKQMMEKLTQATTVHSYPDDYYLYYYNSNINYMISQAQQLGVSYEDYMTATGETEATLKQKAQDAVRDDMIIYYILEAEGLQVTQEEYDDCVQYWVDYYNNYGYNYKAEDIENLFDTYYYPGYLKYQCAEEKAMLQVYNGAKFVLADSTTTE